jgi:glycosyltransferase involved in cell wall biosynthesis
MEKIVRVGIDIGKALGPRDGIGRYIQGLVNALMKIDNVNHYVLYSLLHPADHAEFTKVFKDQGGNFVFRPGGGPRTGEVDLFHSTAHAVPSRYTGKTVFTFHDLTFMTHPEYHTLTNKIHCMTGTIQAACYADAIIAVSLSTKMDLVNHLGIPEEKIEVTHLAVDESLRPDEDSNYTAALADRWGIRGTYILCVGTIEPRKNIMRLIQAYSSLPETLKDKYLLVIAGGGGWMNSDIYSFIKDSGLESSVKILGYVEDSDLPVLYGGCDLFIYPSLYEGFGLPILEAMACGAPVITSQVSSLPEVAGNAAVFVDPHDLVSIREAMASVLTDQKKNRDLRMKGMARSKEFSWHRTAKETLAVYKKVMSGESIAHV